MKFPLYVDENVDAFAELEKSSCIYYNDLGNLDANSDSIVVVGRSQFLNHPALVRELVPQVRRVILCNITEGAETLSYHLSSMGIWDLATSRQISIISGGDMEPDVLNLPCEYLATQMIKNQSNLCAMSSIENIFSKTDKPYQFLFLNGTARVHRKYLLERFEKAGVLERALWTCLDSAGFWLTPIKLFDGDIDLMIRSRSVTYLPQKYELAEVRDRMQLPFPQNSGTFVKYHLFDGIWRDHCLLPDPYIDTYFSLVTETCFEYPWTFRTEKIWKPIMIGHPWICVSNRGFYRDLRNQGFRTFRHIIDESFDLIDDPQRRIERIHDIVVDLSKQDLGAFLNEAQSICRYNQMRFLEYAREAQQSLSYKILRFIEETAEFNSR